MYKNPFEKGRLIIQFNIEFPKAGEIDPKKTADLEKLLPTRPRIEIPLDAEEHSLIDIDPSQSRRGRRGEMQSDDDDMPRGQRVQCANQ